MTLLSDRVSKLQGICNQCGRCCYVDGLKCINLEIIGVPGEPGSTKCKMHDFRTPGMPILLLKIDGTVGSIGMCAHGTSMDDEVILPHIGRGCSLTLRGNGNAST